MKKVILIFSFVFLAFASNSFAQKQIEPQIQRDQFMEADTMHNLDVARQAFKLRKAYKAVLLRTEVIVAAYPEFSKFDEVLYLSGMSSYYLSIGKGKQKIDAKTAEDKAKYAPEKLREDAAAFLSQLVEQFPQSQYKTEAEKTLKQIEAKK
jgi:outer membrane protein assembly factor BamD (BamD/ComL family)